MSERLERSIRFEKRSWQLVKNDFQIRRSERVGGVSFLSKTHLSLWSISNISDASSAAAGALIVILLFKLVDVSGETYYLCAYLVLVQLYSLSQ